MTQAQLEKNVPRGGQGTRRVDTIERSTGWITRGQWFINRGAQEADNCCRTSFKPSVIFMDKPTSGLDVRAAAIVMRTVKNTVDTGTIGFLIFFNCQGYCL